MVAMDWDSLAGLLDIPYEKREEIRTNYVKYPDSTSKAEEVLKDFNCSDGFGRDVFGKCVDELGRHDLMKKLHPMVNEVFCLKNFVILGCINPQFNSFSVCEDRFPLLFDCFPQSSYILRPLLPLSTICRLL